MTANQDKLKGYTGRARSRLSELGALVWSEVRLTNDAGSLFEGVVLPRSETLDDEHVVIKMRNGYNIGVHVDRIAAVEVLGYKEAVYKIPEKRRGPLSGFVMRRRISPARIPLSSGGLKCGAPQHPGGFSIARP